MYVVSSALNASAAPTSPLGVKWEPSHANTLGTPAPWGPSGISVRDREWPEWRSSDPVVGPSAELRPSLTALVSRPGCRRWKAGSRPAATRPGGRAECTTARSPRRSTAARRTGRGTVSVQRCLLARGPPWFVCIPQFWDLGRGAPLSGTNAPVGAGVWLFPRGCRTV